MRLSDYKNAYEDFSGKLSDICRSLSFMGFGVVWILVGGIENLRPDKIPFSLKMVLAGLVLTLILDILHYAYQSIAWYRYFRKIEKYIDRELKKGNQPEDKYNAPVWIANIAWVIYGLKVTLMSASYIVLLMFIAKLIF